MYVHWSVNCEVESAQSVNYAVETNQPHNPTPHTATLQHDSSSSSSSKQSIEYNVLYCSVSSVRHTRLETFPLPLQPIRLCTNLSELRLMSTAVSHPPWLHSPGDLVTVPLLL